MAAEILSLISESFYDTREFIPLLFRFILNTVSAYILIDRIYFKVNKNREFLFTLFIFNILIFFVSSILSDVKMKTGFAFGLFAIFSILRYRTEQVNIKEMTFLFTTIILAVTNSLVTWKVPLVTILFANVTILTAVYILEKAWLKTSSRVLEMVLDDISLIHADRSGELLEYLRKDTGLFVKDVQLLRIDRLKDSADIVVYYE